MASAAASNTLTVSTLHLVTTDVSHAAEDALCRCRVADPTAAAGCHGIAVARTQPIKTTAPNTLSVVSTLGTRLNQ